METLKITKTDRLLGKSTLRVSPLSYGFWRFAGTSVAEATAKVEAALEAGITLFDHADIYGCDGGGQFGDAETLFGEVLREQPGIRDRIVLASKGGIVLGVPYDSSASYIESAVDASLRRMRVDVIDLYQIHRPDFLAHPRELAKVLSRLREVGKIKEVGVSNYTTSQFDALQAHLDFPIATHQPEFSLMHLAPLRDGTLDQCMAQDITPLAWSPLGGGRLMGPDADSAVVELLDQLAEAQGVSRAAVALAWLLGHPAGVIPILGTQRVERIHDAATALDVKLSRTDWNALLVAAQGEPLP